MDGIERAIRSALEKGDAGNRSYREKVYRSAFAALDRALAAKDGITEESRARRREALKATVLRVEREHIAQKPPAPSTPVAPSPAPQAVPPAGRIEPTLDAPRDEPARQPAGPVEPMLAGERDEARVGAASRRSWGGLLVLLVLLVAVVAAGWWAWQSGFVTLPGSGPQQAEEPPTPPAMQEPARQGIQAVDEASWITVFDPRDPTTMTASGDATAQAMDEDGEIFVEARSGASGTAVRFAVGQGVMERIAGGRAVFRISVSADEQVGETQIWVECDLAGLGDCGRRRFLVGITREDFLVETEIASGSPAGAGTISINTDIEGEGRAVRIHSIAVAPAR